MPGDFLFSSSYDKMINVWSLKDCKLVQSFKDHEHRVTAVVALNGEQPLCISSDNEGVIRIWKASFPFSDVLIRKLYEKKDWRYSGIQAMAVSGTEDIYTVGGDKLVKAWSVQIWHNDLLLKSMQTHKGAFFSTTKKGRWLFSGGWNKTINLQEISEGTNDLEATPIGSIACDSTIIALLYWQGKLFVGQADKTIKVYHGV